MKTTSTYMTKATSLRDVDILAARTNPNLQSRIVLAFDKVILKYAQKYSIDGYSPRDMMQEGRIAVFHAISNYDPSQGSESFRRYAQTSVYMWFDRLYKHYSISFEARCDVAA